MKTLKTGGIGTLYIIFIVALVLITLSVYSILQTFLFAGVDYLLLVSMGGMIIPTFALMALIIYIFIRITEKFIKRKKNEITIIEDNAVFADIESFNKLEKLLFILLNKLTINDDTTITKIFKVIKICYIPVLLIAIYNGITSYAVLYDDNIKLGSPIAPLGVIYKYSAIKSVSVGITSGYKNSYSPYYKIIFNDGKSVNFFGDVMQEGKDIGFEYILIDLDKKLKIQGVNKNVDKENFEKYSKGLNSGFVSRVEKLFDDK